MAKKVLRGFEPRLLDSESRVLTVTPQDNEISEKPGQQRVCFLIKCIKSNGEVQFTHCGPLHISDTVIIMPRDRR